MYWSVGGQYDSGNISVGAGDTSVTIAGRTSGLTYDVTLVALSDHLPSPADVVMITLGKCGCMYHTDVCHILKFTYGIAVACICSCYLIPGGSYSGKFVTEKASSVVITAGRRFSVANQATSSVCAISIVALYPGSFSIPVFWEEPGHDEARTLCVIQCPAVIYYYLVYLYHLSQNRNIHSKVILVACS